jgi:hypothetical protein
MKAANLLRTLDKKKFFIILLLPLLLAHLLSAGIVAQVGEDYDTLKDASQFIEAGKGEGWYKNEGFVAMLKIFFGMGCSTFCVRVLLGLIASAGAIPVYFIFKKIVKDETIARVGATLYAYHPILFYYSSRVLTEPMSYFLAPLTMYLGLLFLENYSWKQGVLFGLTTLFIAVRNSSTIFAWLFIGLYWLVLLRELPPVKSILAVLGGATLGLIPYITFNYMVYNHPLYTTWFLFKDGVIDRTYEYTFFIPAIITISWILFPFILYHLSKLRQDAYRKKYGAITLIVLLWTFAQNALYYSNYPFFDLQRHNSLTWIGLSLLAAIGLVYAVHHISFFTHKENTILYVLICIAILALLIGLLIVYTRFFSFESILFLDNHLIFRGNQTIVNFV